MVHPALSQQKSSLPRKPAPFPGRRQVVLTTVPPPLFPTGKMLKHGILGLLNYGDMTGYEIMTVFRDSLNYFWQAQTSQIYRELQGLEKNGWIKSTHIKQENKPDKNLLSITEEGKKELVAWLKDDTGPYHRIQRAHKFLFFFVRIVSYHDQRFF